MVLAAPQLAAGVSFGTPLTAGAAFVRPARRLTVLLILLLALLTLATTVDLVLTLTHALQPENRALTADLYRLDPGWLQLPMIGFTLIGEDPPLDIFALLVAAWAFRRGHRLDALLMVGVAVVARLLGVIMKYAVHQQRPLLHLPPRPLGVLHGYGYPSGHAVLSMAILAFGAVLLARLLGRRPLSLIAAGACGVLVLLIGWSRVYLGFHWLNDVVGGYLFGGLVATIGCLVQAWYRLRGEQRRGPSDA